MVIVRMRVRKWAAGGGGRHVQRTTRDLKRSKLQNSSGSICSHLVYIQVSTVCIT